MIKAVFPCKDCEDRFPGCHGTCERYKQLKAEFDKLKAEAKKQRDVQAGLNQHFYDSMHKINKRSEYRNKYRKMR